MSIFDSLFGNNTTTTTQQQQIAQPAANLATNLFDRTQQYADQPYSQYGGPRVEGFNTQQTWAMDNNYDITNRSSNLANTLSDTARNEFLARPNPEMATLAHQMANNSRLLATTLPGTDLSGYMNPYVNVVLNPAIADIQEESQRNAARLAGNAARTGSFGGSRNALAIQEAQGNTEQEIGRLSANERARAYTEGVNQFRQDQNNIPALYNAAMRGYQNLSDYQGAGYGNLQQGINANQGRLATEVNNLLATGGLQQALGQAHHDVNYQNFVDQRDWGSRGLGALMSALGIGGGALGSSTQTTSQAPQPNAIGQVLGATTGLVGSLGGIGSVANLANSAYNGISSLLGGSSGNLLNSLGSGSTADSGTSFLGSMGSGVGGSAWEWN